MVLDESRSIEKSMAVDWTLLWATFRRPMLSVAECISGMPLSVIGMGFSALSGAMIKRKLAVIGEIQQVIQ